MRLGLLEISFTTIKGKFYSDKIQKDMTSQSNVMTITTLLLSYESKGP
jgi:hypothetical protein